MSEIAKALMGAGWVELPEAYGEQLWSSVVAKGAGHKYVKRVPYTKKNGKKGYRYYYKVQHGKGVHHEDHFVEGAAFQHEGGHYHVTSTDGDTVTVRHDETGKVHKISRRALKKLLTSHHKEAISAHHDKLRQEHADAMKYGTQKQKDAAAQRLKDAGISKEKYPAAEQFLSDYRAKMAKLKDKVLRPKKRKDSKKAESFGRDTTVGNWLHSSYEGTGEFVVDTAWLGGASEAVARSLVERQLQRDVSGWLDRDKSVVSFEAQQRAAQIIGKHGDAFADAAYEHFDNGAKPYVYDPDFIEGWLRSIGEVTELSPDNFETMPDAEPTYYKTREEAQARLISAKAEFPPGSVVTTKLGSRLRIKNWFAAKPGPGGTATYQASVLAEMLDEGFSGDVWENVNSLTLVSPPKKRKDSKKSKKEEPTPKKEEPKPAAASADGYSAPKSDRPVSPRTDGRAEPPKIAQVHNATKDNPVEIDDYPYGRQRTKARMWIETKGNQSRRVSQTMNPRTGTWNKPKRSTYTQTGPSKVVTGDDGYHYFVSDAGRGNVDLISMGSQNDRKWSLTHSDDKYRPRGRGEGDDPGHHEYHHALHGKTLNERRAAAATPEAQARRKQAIESYVSAAQEKKAKEAAKRAKHAGASNRKAMENAIMAATHRDYKKGRGADRMLYKPALVARVTGKPYASGLTYLRDLSDEHIDKLHHEMYHERSGGRWSGGSRSEQKPFVPRLGKSLGGWADDTLAKGGSGMYNIEANGLMERAAKMAVKMAARARRDPAMYSDTMAKVGRLMTGGKWHEAMALMESVMGNTGPVRTSGMAKKSGFHGDDLEKARYTRRWKGPDGNWRYEYPSGSKGKKSGKKPMRDTDTQGRPVGHKKYGTGPEGRDKWGGMHPDHFSPDPGATFVVTGKGNDRRVYMLPSDGSRDAKIQKMMRAKGIDRLAVKEAAAADDPRQEHKFVAYINASDKTKKSSLSDWSADILEKAKYTKRWKGRDGKWRYEYAKEGGGTDHTARMMHHANQAVAFHHGSSPGNEDSHAQHMHDHHKAMARYHAERASGASHEDAKEHHAAGEKSKKKADARKALRDKPDFTQRDKHKKLAKQASGAEADYHSALAEYYHHNAMRETKDEGTFAHKLHSQDARSAMGDVERKDTARQMARNKTKKSSLSDWADNALMKAEHFAAQVVQACARDCVRKVTRMGIKPEVPMVADKVIIKCLDDDCGAELKAVMQDGGRAAIEAMARAAISEVMTEGRETQPAVDTSRSVMMANGMPAFLLMN